MVGRSAQYADNNYYGEQYCGLEAQSSFETSGKWLVSSHF